MKIKISEMRTMLKVIDDLNATPFSEIEWLKDDGTVYQPSLEDVEEFKASGLLPHMFPDFLPSDIEKAQIVRVISGPYKDCNFKLIGLFKDVAGTSWMNSGTPETMNYARRVMRDKLPYNDQVMLGVIDDIPVLCHMLELDMQESTI